MNNYLKQTKISLVFQFYKIYFIKFQFKINAIETYLIEVDTSFKLLSYPLWAQEKFYKENPITEKFINQTRDK